VINEAILLNLYESILNWLGSCLEVEVEKTLDEWTGDSQFKYFALWV